MPTPVTPDWLNVLSAYGAEPTGATDSATAIQSALNAAATAGDTVYFPMGHYKVSASLTDTSTFPLVILGDMSAGQIDIGTRGTCIHRSGFVLSNCSIGGYGFGKDGTHYGVHLNGSAVRITSLSNLHIDVDENNGTTSGSNKPRAAIGIESGTFHTTITGCISLDMKNYATTV